MPHRQSTPNDIYGNETIVRSCKYECWIQTTVRGDFAATRLGDAKDGRGLGGSESPRFEARQRGSPGKLLRISPAPLLVFTVDNPCSVKSP